MKKLIIITCSLLVYSCGSDGYYSTRNNSSGGTTTDPSSLDCSGHKYNLTVPYGIDNDKMAGQVFATVVAVDTQDGSMKVTILPPNGQSSFTTSTTLLDDLKAQGYVIKIIACRENSNSVATGYSVTGVCNSKAQINWIGQKPITGTNLTSDGVSIDDAVVHATADGSTTLKPNFIMITATHATDAYTYPLGELIVAYGKSPYYVGCYSN